MIIARSINEKFVQNVLDNAIRGVPFTIAGKMRYTVIKHDFSSDAEFIRRITGGTSLSFHFRESGLVVEEISQEELNRESPWG